MKKKLKLLCMSLLIAANFSQASTDYKITNDANGMPRCLELNGSTKTSIIINWDQFSNLRHRKVFYRRFEALHGTVCDKWFNFDPTLLRLDASVIEFNNAKAPVYLDEFTLTPTLKRALEQISLGINFFIPFNAFKDINFLNSVFDPFKMETHNKLLSGVGPNITTELYHAYTKEKKITKDCSKLIGTCEYYLCREQNKACGSEGYFLGFGYQYCSDSLKRLMNEVSPVGKKWLKTTATCLHQQMEEVKNSNSCAELKQKAISSHDKCYSEVSFCSLKMTDMLKILKMIHPALTEQGVLVEGIQVLGHCAGI